MADNVTLNAGSGGATIATDDDGTAQHQYVKVEFGGDGTFTKVTSSVGLPVGDAGGSLTVDNAGTFSVQESGGALTALQLIDDTVYVDDADWTDSTSKHMLVGGLYQSTPQTVTDGDVGPFNMTASGAMHVAVQNTVTVGSHNVTNAGTFAVQAAQSGTWTVDLGATDNAVLDAIAASLAGTLTVGSHAVTNAGTFAVQVDGSALTALQLIDDPVFADDAAFTPATSKVHVIGAMADETSPDSVDEGDVGAPRMTLDRQLRTTLGATSVGTNMSVARNIDVDETEDDIKTSAGNLYGYYFANLHATSWRYLKLYNATAANTTVGTTTPLMTIPLPPNSAGHISFPVPIAFSTALCVAATTAVADNDTGAPGANEVVFNAFYA